MNKESIRKLFNGIDSKIHLAACSQSPMSFASINALQNYISDLNEFGNPWDIWINKVSEARSLFARIIKASPDEIAVLDSVSSCFNSLLSSMDFSIRNEVITSDLEFPTTNFILNGKKKYGEVIRTIKSKDGQITPADYISMVGKKTKLVTAVRVSSLNGSHQDVREICHISHGNGSLCYVDDYQALGSLKMDVKKFDIDFLASGTLKWLLGVPGVAFLYVKRELIETLYPANSGWLSQTNPFLFGSVELGFPKDARKFENGTWSIPSLYASIEGMKIILAHEEYIGNQNKALFSHSLDYSRDIGLEVINPEKSANILAIKTKNPYEMESKLRMNEGIFTSARGECLRIAPHFYNTKNEIEIALDKISSLESGESRS